MGLFKGKNVVITGAAGGIGKGISKAFAKEGAKIALIDFDEKNLKEFSEELSSNNYYVKDYILDVRKEAEVIKVISRVLKDFNKIDILVNSAGVSTMNYFWKFTEEEWDFVLDVNLKGVWLVTKHITPHMIERKKGKIVNISSMGGKRAGKFFAHYNASKFGVIGLTQAAALELAPYGINVNSVCPGWVKTPMQDREIVWDAKIRNLKDPKDVIKGYIQRTPLNRLCYPEDVANVVLFLASDSANFMTGQAINITGGAWMN